MTVLNQLTSFDVIVLLILLAFVVRGGWIGFMRQLAAFLALVGSYWLAARYTAQVTPYVRDLINNPKLVFLAGFGLLFVVSAVAFLLAGKVLHRVMEITLLGWFDRFLGVLLGAVKGAILVCLLYMFLISSLSASNDLLKRSVSAPYLARGAKLLHQLIADPRLRKTFLPRTLAIPEEKKPVADKTTSV